MVQKLSYADKERAYDLNKNRNISQSKIAEMLGTSQVTVSRGISDIQREREEKKQRQSYSGNENTTINNYYYIDNRTYNYFYGYNDNTQDGEIITCDYEIDDRNSFFFNKQNIE